MESVTHIIDASIPADMLDQMLLLRQADEPIISLGPAPQWANLPDVKSLHKPFGQENLAGLRLAEQLKPAATVHIWSLDATEAGTAAARQVGGKAILSLPHLPYENAREQLPWDIGSFDCSLTLPTECARQEVLNMGADPSLVKVLPPAAAEPQPDARAAVRQSLGLTDDKILMAVTAEMLRYAGHKFASWGHAIVRQILPQGRLIFPGTGPLESAVRFFADTTGYQDEVFFTGSEYSIPAVDAAADVGLFLYERDRGLVRLAAAMRAGLPIIAGATPDVAAVLTDETNALLTQPSDPRSTSAAMLRLMDEPELARKLGQAGREFAEEHFATAKIRRQLDEIYATV